MKKIFLTFIILLTSLTFGQSELPFLFDDDAGYEAGTYRLLLPDTVYLSTDIEFNIYYKNVGVNMPTASVTASLDSGTAGLSYQWTPTVAGVYDLSLTYAGVDVVSTVLKIADTTISRRKTLLAIGDSRTSATGKWVDYLKTLAGDSLIMLGTQGVAPNWNEGYSGKTYQWMCSDTASPFSPSGYLDFDGYLTTNSFDTLDYVVIRLGTNDVFRSTLAELAADVTTALDYVDSLIIAIHSANANTQVGICLETPPAKNSLFIVSYPNESDPSRAEYEYNIHYFNEQLKARYGYGGSREYPYVTLIPIYLNSDTENDFASGVHENATGYSKNADIIYGWVLNHLGGYSYPFSLATVVGWYRYETATLYSSFSLVKSWTDLSGDGNHLLAFNSDEYPTYTDSTIKFNGVLNVLKDTLTLAQPTTVYLVVKQNTWTSGDYIFDGSIAVSGALRQSGSSPQVKIQITSAVATNNDLTIGTMAIVRVVMDGANSSIRVNDGIATTGNPGTTSMNGFALGARYTGSSGSDIEVKDCIILNAIPDASLDAAIMEYLNRRNIY